MSFTAIALVFILIVIAIGCPLLWGFAQSQKLPPNRPSKFSSKSQASKLVVFIGDSITHGRQSFDYTSMVSEKFSSDDYEFVNAGINGELAWNMNARLDEVIDLQPDYITLMAGTNDGMASLSQKDGEFYRKRAKLPQDPSVEWYKEMMTSIAKKLTDETSAKVAIISIPPLGEDPSHPAFTRSKELTEISMNVANQFDVAYLAANEAMCEYILENPSEPKSHFKNRIREIILAIFKHYLLRRSWDRISSDEGFNLLIDHVHLNSKGAKIVADLIHDFISS
ncbi:MAG: SGNH/GDSL hydrolase family protein [Candidatus Thorarchaeota archaeon]|jgi:lysophospholipase L1-like esterase